jgi:hypothetical protein
MNEYGLTIGQVIDQLRMGEIAYNNKGDSVKYDTNGTLVYFNEESESAASEQRVVILSGYSQVDRWAIKPTFVPFDVAMDELEDGQIVEFHKGEHRFIFKKENEFTLSEMAQAGLTFSDLLAGKWIICI